MASSIQALLDEEERVSKEFDMQVEQLALVLNEKPRSIYVSDRMTMKTATKLSDVLKNKGWFVGMVEAASDPRYFLTIALPKKVANNLETPSKNCYCDDK